MRRRDAISIPPSLQPLLARPPDWPSDAVWRLTAAACRASGWVAWAARLEPPHAPEVWLEGRTPSRPDIVQSECVDALITGLASTPIGAAVEVIAPTSLRYLVEGRAFPPGTPERRLAELAAERCVWPRYALGELERLTDACLRRGYANLAPLRWPGEEASQADYVVYTDGGCARDACAAAWLLRQNGATLAERGWPLAGPVEPDSVRLAEFTAAAEALAEVPEGASVALVTDHADVTDFGVRGRPAFRPSPPVAEVLRRLRERAAVRQVSWYWAERDETAGQRRCQVLIDRCLRAVTARQRFLDTCAAAGLRRVCVPDFERWLAPREPLIAPIRHRSGETVEWAATFEPTDRYLAADPASPRLYLRQIRLATADHPGLAASFLSSRAAGWCLGLEPVEPAGGATSAWAGRLRSGFDLLALLFEPDTALLLQTRPGARSADLLDAAASVATVAV